MALLTARRTAQGIWLGRHGLVRGLETFSIPELPYGHSALEPVITTEVMELHHLQHHQSYVNNYKKALETLNHALTVGDSPTIIRLHTDIKFNGGGHINHSIFWKNLSPIKDFGGMPPKDSLASAINTQFGSLEGLTQKVNAEASDLLGSGWVWLALDKKQKKLSIETTEEEDPLVTKGSALFPLLGIDVWEHAYYLRHHNVKAKYLKYVWNIMNWKYVSEVYEEECPGDNKLIVLRIGLH